ncbi:8-oxo-dGTP diphosphatase [Fictibacillus sp. b24]|uniref:NUDIX hydrolase n=1 Tax=Fictibacillus sp. b24 TaxID=3055863 RepID=UPI0025A2AC40|nr:8-oxo-dGTP diphosphatase [Fictibacillus sp. b24]MDM5316901.1 8-oxo-dGTP diphosphatase [Fictibacillus sp. b24]
MQEYTVCFIQRNQQLLLLNRIRAPLMGLWNGVGGKIENQETIEESVLREVAEETGIEAKQADYKGEVICEGTWGKLHLHFFWINLPDKFIYQTPVGTDEGLLDWKDIQWILHPDNLGIVNNLPVLIPDMMKSDNPQTYHLNYDDMGKIISVSINSAIHKIEA